jgi:hypothetical protein
MQPIRLLTDDEKNLHIQERASAAAFAILFHLLSQAMHVSLRIREATSGCQSFDLKIAGNRINHWI